MSFLVGGVLLLLNLLRLRRFGGAALLMALVVLMMGGYGWLSKWLGARPEYVVMGINVLSALYSVFVLWPNFIGGQTYRTRSWVAPLMIMLLINLLFFLFMQWSGIPMPSVGGQ